MKSGYVAIIGRPNVGKSTLLNRFVGEEVAIVTPKAQTTRQKIVGIYNAQGAQVVFLDTPGFHESKKGINKRMMEKIGEAITDADVILLMVEPHPRSQKPDGVELSMFERCRKVAAKKMIIVINKIDTLGDCRSTRRKRKFQWRRPGKEDEQKTRRRSCSYVDGFFVKSDEAGRMPMKFAAGGYSDRLLDRPCGELVESYWDAFDKTPTVAISAKLGSGSETLLSKVVEFLPEGEPLYPEDQYTEHSTRFLAGEMIREQAMMLLHQELPYVLAVEIESFKESEKLTKISASIIVEKESQKGIVIGAGGRMIKKIGTQARGKIEKLVGNKVFLELFVKRIEDWTKKEAVLKRLGL